MVPARLTIRTNEKSLVREVLSPKGEATNPMSWDDLGAKLRNVAIPRIGEGATLNLEKALAALRHSMDIKPLLDCLSC